MGGGVTGTRNQTSGTATGAVTGVMDPRRPAGPRGTTHRRGARRLLTGAAVAVAATALTVGAYGVAAAAGRSPGIQTGTPRVAMASTSGGWTGAGLNDLSPGSTVTDRVRLTDRGTAPATAVRLAVQASGPLAGALLVAGGPCGAPAHLPADPPGRPIPVAASLAPGASVAACLTVTVGPGAAQGQAGSLQVQLTYG